MENLLNSPLAHTKSIRPLDSGPKKVHFNILDGLRGIAAVLVCIYHFTGIHLPKTSNNITSNLFSEGRIGVYIFFVISGFVIPYVLHKVNYKLTLHEFASFIQKRIIRIWPPSAISILMLVVFWKFIDLLFSSPHSYMSIFSVGGVITNLLYVAPFFGKEWFNGIIWTLSVEFQYYIFIALFFNIIFKNKAFLIISTLCLCAPLFFLPPVFEFQFQQNSVISYVFFIYYPFFALGFLTLEFKFERISKTVFYVLLGVIGFIAAFKFNTFIAVGSIVTSLLIIYVDTKNGFLSFLGKISYSLYLTHMISGAAFEGVVTKLISLDSTTLKITLQFLALVFSIGCAYLFFLLIERPFINLSNRKVNKNKMEKI